MCRKDNTGCGKCLYVFNLTAYVFVNFSRHISRLMAEGKPSSPVPRYNFVCYLCPAQFVTIKEMMAHVEKIGHRMATIGNNNKEILM